MIVALPRFGDVVAPCFEAAGSFEIVEISELTPKKRRLVSCEGCRGVGAVQLMKRFAVEAVICNGIKTCYRDMLAGHGVTVISNVSCTVDEALVRLADYDLTPQTAEPVVDENEPVIPLTDLICWTKELFSDSGYEIRPGEDLAEFPVDLVAQTKCPVCGQTIQIAICCGAHAYHFRQEIREFYRVAGNSFDCCTYVRPKSDAARQECGEYGICYLDPDSPGTACCNDKSGFPLVAGAVRGHEHLESHSNEDTTSDDRRSTYED